MVKQLELLPAVPRVRVRLEDAAPGTEVVRMRLPKAAAGAVLADPQGAQKALEVNLEGLIGYSKWEVSEPPPIDGYWDVTDNRTGTLAERWWFEKSRGPMVWFVAGPRDARRGSVMHDEFVEKGYAWRGLREPHPDVYPTPPYDTAVLMTRAEAVGVTLRTKYAIVTKGAVALLPVGDPPPAPESVLAVPRRVRL